MYIKFEYIVSFILALLVSFSIVPIIKKLAFKIGAVDIPRDDRRMHKKPTARLGGLAIFIGFITSLIFNKSEMIIVDRRLIGLLIGILIILVIGIIDDITPLNARVKLLFQLLAASIVVLYGTRIESITNPFSLSSSPINLIISYIITIFWIIAVTNSINMIDGLDGLAAGISFIASVSLFVISVGVGGEGYSSIIIIALSGATLGFLPYNYNPAKIFMGDTGSTFLGFTLAIVSIQGPIKSYATITFSIPLLILGLPIFDVAVTVMRRIINRKPIMSADKNHLHHKLIDLGLSQKKSVVFMYLMSSFLGLCAIVLFFKGALYGILCLAISMISILGYILFSNVSESDNEFEEVNIAAKINKNNR